MRYFLSLFSLSCILILSSCGGGGTSSTTPANPVQTGVFVDSPVMGLRYETASQSGLTNTSGEYQYLSGETVTFSLGGITLGSAIGGSQITPLDLIGATSVDDAKERGLTDHLTNLLLFLQSLDRDHNPDNGIDLTDLDEALVNEELDFGTIHSLFLKSAYKRIVNEQNGFYQNIKSAHNHFLTSLGATVSVRVPLQDEVDRDGDGVVDFVIDYEYDNAGHLIEVIEPADMASSMLTYDANGKLIGLTFGELDSDSLIFTRTYEYDSLGRIINEVDEDENFADNVARSVTTEYDEVGNITRRFLEQKQTEFDLARHLSTFDAFYIFWAYNPNAGGTPAFPIHSKDRIGTSSGPENITHETLSSYDNNGEIAEKVEYYQYQKTGSFDPWLIVDITTSYQQGKISNVVTQVSLTEIVNGNGLITTDYTLSEAGNVVACTTASTGVFGEVFVEHTFDDTEKNDVLCSTNLTREVQTTVNDKSLITGVEISEWGGSSGVGSSEILENVEPADSRTRIEVIEYEYNDRGQVTEAHQDLTQHSYSGFFGVTGISSQAISYSYTDTGELKSRHDYVDDVLQYSHTRTFQTLELEQLP